MVNWWESVGCAAGRLRGAVPGDRGVKSLDRTREDAGFIRGIKQGIQGVVTCTQWHFPTNIQQHAWQPPPTGVAGPSEQMDK